ncbi:MAG: VOC family protein [Ignavibacteriales bacterium]
MNINIKRTGHTALIVDDVERAAKFYNTYFGFDIIFIFDDWGVVRKNKDDIAFIKKGAPHPPHFGLRVNSREEVDKAWNKLKNIGTKILEEPKLHSDESYSLLFADPDNNAVEIIYDPNIAG